MPFGLQKIHSACEICISQSYWFAYHAILPRKRASACSKYPCRVLLQTQVLGTIQIKMKERERESLPFVSVLLMKSYLTDSDSVSQTGILASVNFLEPCEAVGKLCSNAFGSSGIGHCINPGNNYVRETEPLSPSLNKELSITPIRLVVLTPNWPLWELGKSQSLSCLIQQW